jgi:hypothetical protein
MNGKTVKEYRIAAMQAIEASVDAYIQHYVHDPATPEEARVTAMAMAGLSSALGQLAATCAASANMMLVVVGRTTKEEARERWLDACRQSYDDEAQACEDEMPRENSETVN